MPGGVVLGVIMAGGMMGGASADHPSPAVPAAAVSPAAGQPEKATPPVAKKKTAAAKKAPAPQDDTFEDDYADDNGYPYDNDPWEPVNRAFFEFNRTVDTILLRPVTQAYRTVVPERGRVMVSDFIINLYTPVVFANSIFQFDIQNTFASFWRFVINTTFGIAGLFDVASEAGLMMRDTDLGQTFAIHGADEGPYVVIPLVGPSNVRDAFGRLGDAFLLPVNYMDTAVFVSAYAATAIDARSNNMKIIDDIYSTSLDPYATFRSAYMQKRASDIRRAKDARDASIAKAGKQ